MRQLSDWADILMRTPCYLGYLWAADTFCKRHLGASKKNERMFVFLAFSGHLAWNIAGIWHSVPHILFVAVDHIFFMALVALLFQGSREKKILAASMIVTAATLVENFFVSVLSCLGLFLRHRVEGNPAPVLGDWEGEAISCVSFCLAILAVCRLSKHLASVFWGKPGRWYAMLAIPLLAIVAVFDVAAWGASNGVMVRSGGHMGLYLDQIFSHAEFAVLAAIFLSAAGFYVFGMNRIYLEQEKSSQYHSQIAVYKMLAEQYRQSERLRHDMKNHIIALSALHRNQEWEKMEDYLNHMEGSGLEPHGDVTGNRTVDALLYQKRKRAEEEEIRWECDVQMPKDCCINEFDLCVLFGNLLDNALEACGRMQRGERRFIHVQAKTVKRCFLLEVRNSMDREEKPGGGSAKKENPQEHGIGLMNVDDVVHRYDGVVDIETGNGVFLISILMPLNRRT